MSENFVRVNIRLNLMEIINNKFENLVFDKIKLATSELGYPFLIYLWYDSKNDFISPEILADFIKRWSQNTLYRTVIKSNLIHPKNEFVWFDIVTSKYKNSCNNYRFKYVYLDGDSPGLLEGLDKFQEIIKFCIASKSKKKRQKRND